MTTIDQRITVHFDFPVHFTCGLFQVDNPLLADTVGRMEPGKRHRILFVIDENVAACHPNLSKDIAAYCAAYGARMEAVGEPVLVLGGEPVKNDMKHLFDLVEQVNKYKIDRHSFMAIIGGGAVLDMACFAATIAHRSVRAIRIPTTVLSQDDSGVGVKNGINFFGKKNFIGAFQPPFAVLNDSDFIATLEHRDKIAGVAEAIKVALIRDEKFYRYLTDNRERIRKAELDVMARLIRRSAELHMDHIRTSGDPFELGSARPLDFGHWSAHKMESLTKNRLRHGEAVALGMALDTIYSIKMGFCSEKEGFGVISLMEQIGFRLWEDELLAKNKSGNWVILEGLQEFREHLGGVLHITLLKGIGLGFEVNEMDENMLLESIAWLRDRHNAINIDPVILPDRAAV